MTIISTRHSATIHQFPVGGRAGLTGSSDQGHRNALPAISELALVDAWYHQDAIRQSQQATKQ